MTKMILVGLLAVTLAGCNTMEHKSNADGGSIVGMGTSYEESPHLAATHTQQVKYYKTLTSAAKVAKHATENMTAKRVWSTVHRHYDTVGHILAGQYASTDGFSFSEAEWKVAWKALDKNTCTDVSQGFEQAYRNLATHLKQSSRWRHLAPTVTEWADTENRRQEQMCQTRRGEQCTPDASLATCLETVDHNN